MIRIMYIIISSTKNKRYEYSSPKTTSPIYRSPKFDNGFFRRPLFSVICHSTIYFSRKRRSVRWISAISYKISTVLLTKMKNFDLSERIISDVAYAENVYKSSNCSKRDCQYTISLKEKLMAKVIT